MPVEPYICYNGAFIKQNQAVIHIHNRSFKYGDGIFETIRINSKKILFFENHFDRILYSCKILNLKLPESFNRQNLALHIIRLLNTNRLFQGAKVRISIFRADGGLYTPDNNDAQYIIEAVKTETENYVLNRKGLYIDIYKDIPKPQNVISSLKSSNALIYVLAGLHKLKNKLDDCLLVNDNNHIVEAISSNIFIIKGNTILTPSLNDGCVHGIIRNNILDITTSLKFIVYDDAHITVNDILNADEVFLTNAVSGIKWVVAFRNTRFYNKTIKILINQLNKHAILNSFQDL